MNRISTFLFVIFITICGVDGYGQNVVINEFMSNNETCLQDEDGHYSDWIELYNRSDSLISMAGFSISDDSNDLDKWSFPNVAIQPNGYLVIFASGKNRLSEQELHTNFSIRSDGEELFLTNLLGVVIDQTTAIALADDESHGRLPDGESFWATLLNCTANATNNVNDHLSFSHSTGFYNEPFDLEIESLMGDTVRFTLDGSDPTDTSEVYPSLLQLGFKYSDPNILSEIPTSPEQTQISYKAWESPGFDVEKAHVLRSATFRNGQRTSEIFTQTFFVDSAIYDRYDMPVMSIVTEKENLFDPQTGIYVPGHYFSPENPEWTGNYFQRGESWERPVHIEFFDQDGVLKFAQNAGVRIHGGKSRQASQKSLRFYARNKYGTRYFDHQLLPQKELDQYKRFVLRATMGSWSDESIIKDVLAHELVREINIDFQDYQPVVLFINGEYWGIHTIRDRVDERYVSYTHDVPRDSVVLRKDDNALWDDLVAFLEANDLSETTPYEYVKSKINLSSFIDYYIAELFFANYDWLPNNEEVWREVSDDGKWRWIFYDLDASMGYPGHNMFHQVTHSNADGSLSTPAGTFFFRQMLKNNDFRSVFLSRCAEVLNHDLTSEKAIETLEDLKALYAPEVTMHSNRWKYPYNYSSWETDLQNGLSYFLENRKCKMEEHIVDFFQLSEFEFMCGDLRDIDPEINIIVGPNPSTGYVFYLNNTSYEFVGNIQIANTAGRVVRQYRSVNIEPYEKRYDNLSDLAAGMYLIHFTGSEFSHTMRVFVQGSE